MTLPGLRTVPMLGIAIIAAACSTEAPIPAADIVFFNGNVHTATLANPAADALAVRGSDIVFVGTDDNVRDYIDDNTEVIDLDGRMLLPGIVDAHLHPLGGAVKELYQCNFPFSATPDDIANAISDCVAAQPDISWISGGQWDSAFFDRFDVESPREFLDAVSGDKAILLSDDSGHNAWVNSKALELAQIDSQTADPPGGTIQRDNDGNPNGVLLETAQGLVYAVLPELSEAQFLESARWFTGTAHAFGITAIKAAAIEENEMQAFRDLDQEGGLNLHVATSIRTPYGYREEILDYEEIDRLRDTYASNNVHTGFVKIFLDGVPTPARTAAMLEPYVADEKHGDNFTGGPLHVDKTLLAKDLVELEKRGYTVKIHTAGDRSVRDALDAIESLRKTTGAKGLRHELAHAGYIHNDDLPRFAELNAVADLSPVIWHPSPIIDAVFAAVGEDRGSHYWPVRDLLDSDAAVLAGSDWPSAVPDANPWVGIEAFVTRSDPRSNDTSDRLWPEQAISLEEAIAIYTRHGARALRLEHQIGTLEVGKRADLIVLDRDLFAIDISAVGDTSIDRTYFGGELVYSSTN